MDKKSVSLAKERVKEIVEAHWCKECDGKIIAISMDMFGNTYCGYCKKRVYYPTPSKSLIKEIKDEINKNKDKKMCLNCNKVDLSNYDFEICEDCRTTISLSRMKELLQDG